MTVPGGHDRGTVGFVVLCARRGVQHPETEDGINSRGGGIKCTVGHKYPSILRTVLSGRQPLSTRSVIAFQVSAVLVLRGNE